MQNIVSLLVVVNLEILLNDGVTIFLLEGSLGLQFDMQLMVGLTLSFRPCLSNLPSKSLLTLESFFQAEINITATQTAALVVGSPDLEVFFRKTKLRGEDTLYTQCRAWGHHWWNPMS